MKKHICIILLAALLLFCACQPTPDEPDASGRRSPVETGETVTLPCDTLIAAVGEKIETVLRDYRYLIG
jgi:NADPH-dependent glutamate synthase beta subunit-like oxidoreductase